MSARKDPRVTTRKLREFIEADVAMRGEVVSQVKALIPDPNNHTVNYLVAWAEGYKQAMDKVLAFIDDNQR